MILPSNYRHIGTRNQVQAYTNNSIMGIPIPSDCTSSDVWSHCIWAAIISTISCRNASLTRYWDCYWADDESCFTSTINAVEKKKQAALLWLHNKCKLPFIIVQWMWNKQAALLWLRNKFKLPFVIVQWMWNKQATLLWLHNKCITWKTNGKSLCTWHSKWCSHMEPKLVSWSLPTFMHQPIL